MATATCKPRRTHPQPVRHNSPGIRTRSTVYSTSASARRPTRRRRGFLPVSTVDGRRCVAARRGTALADREFVGINRWLGRLLWRMHELRGMWAAQRRSCGAVRTRRTRGGLAAGTGSRMKRRLGFRFHSATPLPASLLLALPGPVRVPAFPDDVKCPGRPLLEQGDCLRHGRLQVPHSKAEGSGARQQAAECSGPARAACSRPQ